MQTSQIAEYIIDTFKKRGIDKVQCSISNSEKRIKY